MSDNLFEYEDPDGDEIFVTSLPRGSNLRFGMGPSVDPYLVDLNASAINHLHALLGAWLADNGITARPVNKPAPAPLTPADVRELVRQEVVAVLPLHLSSPAAVNPNPQGPEYCTCHEYYFKYGKVHFAHDPEPTDVGHPSAPDVLDPYSKCECRHYLVNHDSAGCDTCKCIRTWSPPEYAAPPLAVVQPNTRKCPGCAHSEVEHSGVQNQCLRYLGKGEVCKCTQVQP
jgi:hypothetical protein